MPITGGYCWQCMDPPPMSRRNRTCDVLVQMLSCIRPLAAGYVCPAGHDAICASPPDQPEAQGHLVFGEGVAQQVQNKLKGFVPHGALLAWHAPHEPKPCLQVDLYDSTAAAPHQRLRRDSRLSPLSGQTPSLACHALAGLLCDVVWLPQLECHGRMGAQLWHRYR